MSRVNLDFGSDAIEDTHRLATDTMKRCERCGYAHLQAGEAHLAEVCDRCGDALDTPSRIDHLVRMQNVSLRHAQRITCDEEERQRFGYHLVTAYRFPEVNGRLDRKDAEVRADGACVLTLSYGDATDLYRINLGWTHQDGSQPRSFNLDLERGYWSRNQADAENRDDAAAEGRIARVVPFVRDTRNALVMRFEPARAAPEMASLQAAFKQAIQQHFQLEPREPNVGRSCSTRRRKAAPGCCASLPKPRRCCPPSRAGRSRSATTTPTPGRIGPRTDAAGRAVNACWTTATSPITGFWTAR